MTPLAASILGYALGLATAFLVFAILLIVRGGRAVDQHERRRRDDQVDTKGRGW
jgi:hypothetical protein